MDDRMYTDRNLGCQNGNSGSHRESEIRAYMASGQLEPGSPDSRGEDCSCKPACHVAGATWLLLVLPAIFLAVGCSILSAPVPYRGSLGVYWSVRETGHSSIEFPGFVAAAQSRKAPHLSCPHPAQRRTDRLGHPFRIHLPAGIPLYYSVRWLLLAGPLSNDVTPRQRGTHGQKYFGGVVRTQIHHPSCCSAPAAGHRSSAVSQLATEVKRDFVLAEPLSMARALQGQPFWRDSSDPVDGCEQICGKNVLVARAGSGTGPSGFVCKRVSLRHCVRDAGAGGTRRCVQMARKWQCRQTRPKAAFWRHVTD